MYKLRKNVFGEVDMVERLSDGGLIPFSSQNTDYQAYLEWLAEGNVPTPADEPN